MYVYGVHMTYLSTYFSVSVLGSFFIPITPHQQPRVLHVLHVVVCANKFFQNCSEQQIEILWENYFILCLRENVKKFACQPPITK